MLVYNFGANVYYACGNRALWWAENRGHSAVADILIQRYGVVFRSFFYVGQLIVPPRPLHLDYVLVYTLGKL
jgi:hypothetical protein